MELPTSAALRFTAPSSAEQRAGESSEATDRQALLQAARQFEALFVEQMLAAMRETLADDNPMAGEHEDVYREMLDRELAGRMTERDGYGLAEALVRQLAPEAQTGTGAAADVGRSGRERALSAYRSASSSTD